MGLTDFEILTKIGEGSFSSVWKVRRISDGQEYALKKVKLNNLSSKEKSNSVNEIRILASIQQANVIGYKEAFLEENATILCIVMEYAGGGDLYQKIQEFDKNQAYFKEQQVWNYAVQMILGLRALHKMKILHRDFKSANIFLSKDGKEAKIGDLNVSKVLKSHLSYTQTGTPYYASPEVWRDQPYDMKSDIWSLGAKDMDGLYKKVQKGTFNRIPIQYSDDLMTLISMCLKLTASQRPTCEALLSHPVVQRNCREYLRDLEEAPFIKNALLETIRIPKNLRSLGSMLPKPNYLKERVNTEATVDIRKIHQKSEVNLKNYVSLGHDSIGKTIPSEADYSSAKVESISGNRLANILRTDSRAKKTGSRGEQEALPTGSSENLYVKVRKIKLDDFSIPKELTAALTENMKNGKPPAYKYLVAKKIARKSQQLAGNNDSKKFDSVGDDQQQEVEIKRKSLNPNMRSKSTATLGTVDPEKPRRSLATGESVNKISVLDNGKGVVQIKDIFPQKILLKPADIVSSYRNQNNTSEEKNNSLSLNIGGKQLMDKVLDEIPTAAAQIQKANVVILRHKVPKRATNNKSSLGIGRATEGSYVDSTKDFSANLSNENNFNLIPIKKYILKTPSDTKSNPRPRKRLEQQYQSQPNIHKLANSNVISRESPELYLQKRRQKSRDDS